MKVINKGDSNDTDGNSNNTDNDAIDYGDNHGDSYSNHHEIYDDKDDKDDDNSNNNDQVMNAQITLHIGGEDFLDSRFLLNFFKFRMTVHGICYKNIFKDVPELF